MRITRAAICPCWSRGICLICLLFFSFNCYSQLLGFDPSFDGDGIKELNPGTFGSAINCIVQQPDGKILSTGTGTLTSNSAMNYIVSRYLLNGDLDTTFGIGGIVTGGFDSVINTGKKMLLQPDGKILVGGYTAANPIALTGVTRLNSDGSYDTSFHSTGTALFDLTPDDDMLMDMLLQPDGKIILGGYSSSGNGFAGSFIIRLMPDGNLDTLFNGTGILLNNAYLTDYDQTVSLALQQDGKIISLASTFVNPAGRNLLKRFNTDGSIDTTFGNNGSLIYPIGIVDDSPGVVQLQPDGKIIVAGNTTIPIPNSFFADIDYAIGRFNTDGTPDSSFNGTGKIIIHVSHNFDAPTAVRLDNSGNIYIAGYSNVAPLCLFCVDMDMNLVKLLPNGTLDINFAYSGIQLIDFGIEDNVAYDMIIQQDGKFLLGGYSSFGTSYNQMAMVRLIPSATGIDPVSDSESIFIYPNPFTENFTIKPSLENEKLLLRINDISGKLILEKTITCETNFNTSEWAKGFYFYFATTGSNKIISGKLLKVD